MARDCGPGRWVDFERTDRDYVSWSSEGLSGSATAVFELESDGVMHALAINHSTGEMTGYFAGPSVTTPGSAVVVPTTSHVEIHITDGAVARTLDGGFIRLVP